MSQVLSIYCDRCGFEVKSKRYWTLRYQGPTARRVDGRLAISSGLSLNGQGEVAADICEDCIAELNTPKM